MNSRASLAAIGDIGCLVAFVLIGAISHEGVFSQAVLVRTGLPFTIAWIAVGVVSGTYRTAILVSPRKTFRRLLACWPIAWAAGLLLRTWWSGGSPPPTFVLVSLLVPGVLLLGWRGSLAVVLSRHQH